MKERVKAVRASEKKSHYNEKGQTKGAFETSKVNKLQYQFAPVSLLVNAHKFYEIYLLQYFFSS
jgi:hypothetical protein